MLPYQQNNLSRALAAAAGTVGEYAKAAHEDRIANAKLQFEQMLENNRMKAQQQQHEADASQRASEFSDSLQLRKDQLTNEANRHAADASQRASEFSDSLQLRKDQLTNETNRHAADASQRASEFSDSLQLKKDQLTNTTKHQAAQDATMAAWRKAQVANNAARLALEKQRTDAAIANKQTLMGLPNGTPQVRKDAQGKLWMLGPDGQKMPYNPGADASQQSSSLPMMDSTDPSQQAQSQLTPANAMASAGPATDPSSGGLMQPGSQPPGLIPPNSGIDPNAA